MATYKLGSSKKLGPQAFDIEASDIFAKAGAGDTVVLERALDVVEIDPILNRHDHSTLPVIEFGDS